MGLPGSIAGLLSREHTLPSSFSWCTQGTFVAFVLYQDCDWMGADCTPDSRPGATVSECLTPEQVEEAPDRFLCPISLDIMTDPVLLVCTGQVYDYPSLMTWFESGDPPQVRVTLHFVK